MEKLNVFSTISTHASFMKTWNVDFSAVGNIVKGFSLVVVTVEVPNPQNSWRNTPAKMRRTETVNNPNSPIVIKLPKILRTNT